MRRRFMVRAAERAERDGARNPNLPRPAFGRDQESTLQALLSVRAAGPAAGRGLPGEGRARPYRSRMVGADDWDARGRAASFRRMSVRDRQPD